MAISNVTKQVQLPSRKRRVILQYSQTFIHEFTLNMFVYTYSGVRPILIREFMSSFSIFKNHLGAPCPCCLEKLLPGQHLLGFTVNHFYDTKWGASNENMCQWAISIQSGGITAGFHNAIQYQYQSDCM